MKGYRVGTVQRGGREMNDYQQEASPMSTKAHPHAESMKLYAEDAAETDKPWERWEFRRPGSKRGNCWVSFTGLGDQPHPSWSDGCEYRRKPVEPTLLQGHTMEQWEFVIEQGFDCEFSDSLDFSNAIISKLTALKIADSHPFVSGSDNPYLYCRPRRAKGIKQPWFGGECPVDPATKVIIYMRNGDKVTAAPWYVEWRHANKGSDVIAFIEL